MPYIQQFIRIFSHFHARSTLSIDSHYQCINCKKTNNIEANDNRNL
jgi:hypothetical protein